MHLSDHSLHQIDDANARLLDVASLRDLSLRLLADLPEAREWLNQGPTNRLRPPRHHARWERGGPPVAEPNAAADYEGAATADVSRADAPLGASAARLGVRTDASVGTAPTWPAATRRPGKQPGAPGFVRTQVFTTHDTQAQRPTRCAGCVPALSERGAAVADNEFQPVDLCWDDPATPSLCPSVVDYQYEETTCKCGHQTRARPAQCEVDPTLGTVQLCEWRLVGPAPATSIVALNLRFRMSRARPREFLWTWFGMFPRIGTHHQKLHKAAAALPPAEPQLIAAIHPSDLLHADETSWPQQRQLRCLWVFRNTPTTYLMAGRAKATVTRLLPCFTSWLMIGGWNSYHGYPHRLRCLGRLLRTRPTAGPRATPRRDVPSGAWFPAPCDTLLAAIYTARDDWPVDRAPGDLPCAQAARLAALRQGCITNLGHCHDKTQGSGGRTEQLLGRDLPGAQPSGSIVQRGQAGASILSDHPRRQIRYPHRREFPRLNPAGKCDRYLRPTAQSASPHLATAIADRRVGPPLASLPQAGCL